VKALAGDVGGSGSPYTSGSFSVAANGTFAFTYSRPRVLSDVAVGSLQGGAPKVITTLNDDLFANKTLGAVEEIWCESSLDKRKIQGWIMKPPGFDPAK
jgi:acylaminoacyl-peptidase